MGQVILIGLVIGAAFLVCAKEAESLDNYEKYKETGDERYLENVALITATQGFDLFLSALTLKYIELPEKENSSGPRPGEVTGRKIWTGKDKYVPETANAIEQKYPGRVQSVERILYDANGIPITDLDIELDSIVIQVKSGTAKGLTSQMLRTANATEKKVVSYTPDISQSSAVLKGVRENGFETFTTIEDLLSYIANH